MYCDLIQAQFVYWNKRTHRGLLQLTSCRGSWNAAARVITGTRKFDRGLTQILHNELHWLDVLQRVIFKLCTTVYKCLHCLAPQYLAELCVPVADVPGRRHLRSASRGLLDYPRYKLSNYGRRAFSHAGPYYWNSLPYNMHNSVSITSFKRALKHSCSIRIRIQRITDNYTVWCAIHCVPKKVTPKFKSL